MTAPKGDELISIKGLNDSIPVKELLVVIGGADGSKQDIKVRCRIDTGITSTAVFCFLRLALSCHPDIYQDPIPI